jgi:hypothetical protein
MGEGQVLGDSKFAQSLGSIDFSVPEFLVIPRTDSLELVNNTVLEDCLP